MNEEQFLLANAYFDGEITDEERRLAEADPAVMAEVEQLRALHHQIRDVEPPSVDARERAIEAAMAQFASAGAAPAAPAAAPAPAPAAPARTYGRRPSYARYLAVAAAVVSVGLLGVVIARAPGGDDDSAGDMVAEPASEDAADEAGALFERSVTESFEPAAEEPASDAASELAADDMAADDMAADDDTADGDMADDMASGDEPASEPADEMADEPVAALVPGTGLSVEMPITDLEQLAAFGADLLVQRDDGLLPPTPNTKCTTPPGILSRAFYVFDDVVIEIEVAVDETGEVTVVSAIDPETCDVLDQVALP